MSTEPARSAGPPGAADADLLRRWRAAAAEQVTGWDFADLAGSYAEPDPPWSYEELAREALAGARSALDLGTGGGEVLRRLSSALPADSVATEGWPPNLPVAVANLAPLGIPVVAYDAEQDPVLPFPGERFDVVLDRHEAYSAAEVFRVLRPGGRFLTQQVDGRDFEETHAMFGGQNAYSHITLANLEREAADAGFVVSASAEWSGQSRFADVTALVRYLVRVPWQVPDDFSVDRYAQQLLDLQHSGHPLVFTARRFYLLASRPG